MRFWVLRMAGWIHSRQLEVIDFPTEKKSAAAIVDPDTAGEPILTGRARTL
jgi:hypothetical protein